MARKIDTDANINSVRFSQQTSHPSSPASGYESLYIISGSAHGGLYVKDSGGRQIGPFITGTASASAIYPQDAIAFINQFAIVSGVAGGFTKGVDNAQFFNMQYFQATPADGDAIQTTVLLKAGTYDVYVLGIKSNNRGKVDWTMDGGAAFISGQDWYNAAPVQNAIMTGTVTIASSGRHILKGTINGKNASSSNYYFVITAVWLVAQSQSTET